MKEDQCDEVNVENVTSSVEKLAVIAAQKIPKNQPSMTIAQEVTKKNKKGKKQNKYQDKQTSSQKIEETTKSNVIAVEETLLTSQLVEIPLEKLSPPTLVVDDHESIDNDAIMKISMHKTIGDEEIEIIPLEENVTIQDSPEKSSTSDVEVLDAVSSESDEKPASKIERFIKNEDFYDIDDELPPLEPLEPFDSHYDDLDDDFSVEKNENQNEIDNDEDGEKSHKEEMIKKMSEMLKDTNMIFAMCSSLKDIKDDDECKSMSSSSHIQRSTSSSLTTNTTTATFASANSNQIGEGQDSDYKSLELEMEEATTTTTTASASNEIEESCAEEFKVPAMPAKAISVSIEKEDDPEDVSSFEATSSETDATDDSTSKKSNTVAKFKPEDDEELRPLLLETSTTSLTMPSSSSSSSSGTLNNNTNTTTTEANITPTLPEINQKSQQATSNNNNNNSNGKRKNKKKRR
jgi:hypothetical protein